MVDEPLGVVILKLPVPAFKAREAAPFVVPIVITFGAAPVPIFIVWVASPVPKLIARTSAVVAKFKPPVPAWIVVEAGEPNVALPIVIMCPALPVAKLTV